MNFWKKQFQALTASIQPSGRQKEIKERLLSRMRFYSFNKQENYMWLQNAKEAAVLPLRLAHSLGTLTLVILSLLSVGVGTALAANFSNPGDLLYNVRITIESMPLVLPFSEESKIETELKLATKRQHEIEKIIYSNDKNTQKAKKIQEAAKYLSLNMESAHKRVARMGEKAEDGQLVEFASALKISVVDIKNSLNKAVVAVEGEQIDSNATKELRKVSDTVSAVELTTLGVIIAAVQESNNNSMEVQFDSLEHKEQNGEPLFVPNTSYDQAGQEKISVDDKNNKDQEEKTGAFYKVETEAVKLENTSSSTSGADQKDIKGKIADELLVMLQDFEKKLSSKRASSSPVLNASSTLQSFVPPKKGEELTTVLLNVEDFIIKEQEMTAKEAYIQELIKEAYDAIEKGDLQEALEIIQDIKLLI